MWRRPTVVVLGLVLFLFPLAFVANAPSVAMSVAMRVFPGNTTFGGDPLAALSAPDSLAWFVEAFAQTLALAYHLDVASASKKTHMRHMQLQKIR